jgi:CBS domain containing-hemolysin-like protein
VVFIAILIALTAFFVASEFAIIRIRSSRVDQLIEEGNSKALSAKKVISNLDDYLSACQLGITINALGLGWLGESTLERILRPLFQAINLPYSLTHVFSIVLAFAVITFIHVVVGELAPKSIAIQKAESISLIIVRPLILFYKMMYPFILLLNGSAKMITSIFGLKPISESEVAHTEEELRMILSESFKSGEINQSEFKYVNKIFEFDNRIAKEIMVPRTEIISLSKDDTLDTFLKVFQEEKFTRYPIIDGDKDHIIGLVNIKEIMTALIGNEKLSSQTLEKFTRPIIRVIETIPIHDLLVKMQKDRIHMAVLMDEYGGTSGLVTVEDILEEIVGEIRDEFDMDEIPMIRKVKEHHYIVDSKLLVTEVNDLLGTEINDEDIDTIGGWFLTEEYEAKEGDTISYDAYTFKIIEMEEHHIKYIEIVKTITDGEDSLPNIPISESEVLS